MPARFFTWIFILLFLTLGAVLWWRLQGKNEGQAAETISATVPGPTSSILVGHWTLDGNDVVWGDTSTEIKDVSGYAKHGNFSNNLSTGSATAGRIGQGLVFNGTSDSVSLGSVYNGVKTIAFWVKPNSTTQSVIDLNATATVDINAGTVRGNNFSTPTIYVDGAATAIFPDTGWHHVAITTATGINASAAYLGLISSTYFGGILDDIRFYSTEFSATQAADLYRSSGAKEISNANHRDALTDGLVGYWTFDGRDTKWSDTETEIKDISGNNNHGNASGLTTASAVPGKLGQGLSFDGSDDIVDLLGNTYSPTLPYSVTFWVRGSSQGTGCDGPDPRAIYAESRTYSASFPKFILAVKGPKAHVCLRANSGNTLIDAESSSNILDNGEWHFIVWTDTMGSAALYIDGTRDATDFSYSPESTSSIDNRSIGARRGDGFSYSYFDGSSDDVRTYNRALSESEVINLYNLGR